MLQRVTNESPINSKEGRKDAQTTFRAAQTLFTLSFLMAGIIREPREARRAPAQTFRTEILRARKKLGPKHCQRVHI